MKAEHAERLVRDAERAEGTLSEREERAQQWTEAMAASGYSEGAFEEAQVRHQAAEKDLREQELRAASVKGDEKAAAAAAESIARRIAERGERAAKVSTIRADLLLHDELDASLEGLRAELNAKLRPDLSDLGSTFVAELTEGRYQEFELDENYRMGVLEDGVPNPSSPVARRTLLTSRCVLRSARWSPSGPGSLSRYWFWMRSSVDWTRPAVRGRLISCGA